ncbi:MAG: GGDEF domain-containing protein [Acidobacteriaceae bacterium]
MIVFRDVSVARALTSQIAHSAAHDSLTDLPNRVLLNDRLCQAIALAGRQARIVAVLFLDLDSFKNINDSLGHSTGDKLLHSIATRLRDCVRTPDTVSRQGGDEFVVLLQDVRQAEEVVLVAKRILKAVAVPHAIDHHALHVTASIGVSVYPGDGQDAETLIKNADTAVYQAKEGGRHGYKFFRPERSPSPPASEPPPPRHRLRLSELRDFCATLTDELVQMIGQCSSPMTMPGHQDRRIEVDPIAPPAGLHMPGGNRLMTCKCKFKPGNKTENQTCHPNIV